MIVRVLAVLVTLGLVTGSVDARTYATPTSAALTISVDQSDDLAEIEMILPVAQRVDDSARPQTSITSDSPPHYEPCWFVFRPPRAPAFN